MTPGAGRSPGTNAADLSTGLRGLVGELTARRLADKLDLHTVNDLLRYYPRRYERRGQLTDLAQLRVGERVTVLATVRSAVTRAPRAARGGSKVRSITEITVGDSSRRLTCTFFNQAYLVKRLPAGTVAMFSGAVSVFRSELRMTGPQVALMSADGSGQRDVDILESFPGGVIPVYPLVEGVSLTMLQRSVQVVLGGLPPITDPLPDPLVAARGLTDLDSALRNVHRPPDESALRAARARLRYDEALAVQLVLARRRRRAQDRPAEPCPPTDVGVLAAFDAALPFELTTGQCRIGEQLAADLAGMHPMNRLLQGEVGSGKTVVALRAMLQATDAGRQAALLAPTEVLAAQHARSLREVLGPFGRGGELGAPQTSVRIALLTGSMPTATRRDVLAGIEDGSAGIVVGTHALLSDSVHFARLGLLVVDEQHRFGVEQRDALRNRHSDVPPHVLVMTATPIPRTVAMTVYGDLETSTLTELPTGRSPIATTVVPADERPEWMDRAWTRAREEVARGHQVYVVCPKIGDETTGDVSDSADAVEYLDLFGALEKRAPVSVTEMSQTLADGPLEGLRLAIVHGRLPAAEKDDVMVSFAAGLIDVLVSTTVIEVGVDVANATMMVVMDADRFGMSALHQLRGRVGRGPAGGVCLLVTTAPEGSPARDRLAAVAGTTDGFALAEADLGLRREGDVLGTSQAGRSSGLKQLRLLEHREIIEAAREDARALTEHDPDLREYPGLADMVASVIAEGDEEYLEKS